MKNIINLTFNLDRFTLIEDTSDLEKVGLTHQLKIRGAIPASELERLRYCVEFAFVRRYVSEEALLIKR